MRLLFSTEKFIYSDIQREGIPIILGDDLHPLQPFQEFMVWLLLEKSGGLSRLTWEDYGRRFWDFVMFLNANNLKWDEPVSAIGKSVVSRYRDWSLKELALNAKTINARLRLVVAFYEWAQKRKLIDKLPFSYRDARVERRGYSQAHYGQSYEDIGRPNVLVREWQSTPEFLSIEELQAVRSQHLTASHRLLFNLMTRVGLRSCEARSFPLKYVFNPEGKAGCGPGRMIRIRLSPRDMHIKYAKPREVDVPYSLMQEMYAYTLFERNRLAVMSDIRHGPLLLTSHGTPFSKDSVGGVFRVLTKKVGFRVTALMLRHSYAVHTLRKLLSHQDFEGEPLLYVRDQLGHTNVQTTIIYLRQINKLAGGLTLAMEDEFDQMFEIPNSI